MAGYFTYLALLAFWVLLIYPGWRLGGGKRVFVLSFAGVGALAAAYEAWLFFIVFPGASNPIRVDILLIAPLLWGLYAGAVAALFRAGASKIATILAVVIALIGAEIVYLAVGSAKESARLTANFHERNALLFAAKFRSQGDYEAYFGPLQGPATHPTGHFVAEDHWQFTRLIINGAGQAWLFYRCSEAECHYRSRAGEMQAGEDGAWKTVVSARVLQDVPLIINQESLGRLIVGIKGEALGFTAAPPPVDPAPAPKALTYLGSFSGHRCIRQHTRVRQVWLWRGGNRLLALGVFETFVAGRRADFISPTLMGSPASADGVWNYEWDGGKADIVLEKTGVRLSLEQSGREAEQIVLTPGAIVEDEVITLAPRTDAQDWRHWFDVAITGHSSSGDMPACGNS